jgi:hypothetical protein
MKSSGRWVLFLGSITVLILGVHYFLAAPWASYPMVHWGFHRFGPRIFPWGSLLGVLAVTGIGFLLYKLIFPSSDSQATKEEEDSCPYCGREFEQGEEIPKKGREIQGSGESESKTA